MNISRYFPFLLVLFLLTACSTSKYLVVNKKLLKDLKEKDNTSFVTAEAIKNLFDRSNVLLNEKIMTILDKKIIPPSGDKHDYISYAIYYWPDSANPSSHWIYKDGKINKSTFAATDRKNFYQMLSSVKTLSAAYYLSKKVKYADKAAEFIKVWFLNDSTKMNPNRRYAQGIPGKNDGTPSGIIGTRGLIWVIDAINLISDSQALTQAELNSFSEWIAQYLEWLTKSDFALREFMAKNNHGTYYDLQKLAFAYYTKQDSIALNAIESIKTNRIKKQILPDGSQPLEIARADGFHYSLFNVMAFVQAAILAEKYNVDLWNYSGKNSGSIIDAVKYLTLPIKNNKSKVFVGDKIEYELLFPVLLKVKEKGFTQFNEFIPEVRSKVKHIQVEDIFFFN